MNTDYELLRADLLVVDPSGQVGLCDSIPLGVDIAAVLNTYVFARWPHEKAWCAKCRAHRHRFGFTAELSDGSKVMLGSKCGADAFGKSWRDLHKSFKSRFKRQSYLQRLGALGPKLLTIAEGLLKWLPHAKRHRILLKQFQTAMPDLFAVLQQAARTDGVLTVFVKIDARERAKWQGGAASEWVSAPYHNLQGRSFLAVSDAEQLVDSALELVNSLSRALASTDGVRTEKLVAFSKAFDDTAERLRGFADAHDAWPKFASHSNLSRVAEWATQSEAIGGNYVAKGSCLMWTSRGKAVHVDAGYAPLNRKLLGLFFSDYPHKEERALVIGSSRR